MIRGINQAPEPPMRSGVSMMVATGGVNVTEPAMAEPAESIAATDAISLFIIMSLFGVKKYVVKIDQRFSPICVKVSV